jgi:AraC-like DNA-binding protein
MQRAASMLREGTEPVKQVGADLGYASGTVFGRSFRRLFGLTPSECRRTPSPGSPAEDQPSRLS